MTPSLSRRIAVVAAAALLAACSSVRLTQQTCPPSDMPQVTVIGTTVFVAPDPLDFRDKPGPATITWTLPKDSTFTFARNGIVIEDSKDPFVRAADEFKCSRPDPQRFVCENLHRGKGMHKYTINVVRDGDYPLPPKDPHIVN